MMKGLSRNIILICLASIGLSACATITGNGKENAPPPSQLVSYRSQVTPIPLWTANTGSGTKDYYLKLVPAVNYASNQAFTADQSGNVVATDLNSGKTVWQINLGEPLVTGPAVAYNTVLVGGTYGDLYALQQRNGQVIWHISLPDQVIAPPVAADDSVIVKTLDGRLLDISLATGQIEWQYSHGAPIMVMAGGGVPIVVGNQVIVGWSDGKLSAYSLSNGSLLWEHPMAQPSGASEIEQMIDLVADPVRADGVIYVVNYQGNLSAVSASSGEILWQQPLSSYTGMAISGPFIFVTDASGVVWAYDRQNGHVLWQQNYMRYRKLTAPAAMGNNIVIADGEGYVHWLSQANGITVGRAVADNNTPIIAAPIVNGNRVYVLSTEGLLAGFAVR